jgi:hypothetical protein
VTAFALLVGCWLALLASQKYTLRVLSAMVKSLGYFCVDWFNVPIERRRAEDRSIQFVLHAYREPHLPRSWLKGGAGELVLAAMSQYHVQHRRFVKCIVPRNVQLCLGSSDHVATYVCPRYSRAGGKCNETVKVYFDYEAQARTYKVFCNTCVASYSYCHVTRNAFTLIDRGNRKCAKCPVEFLMVRELNGEM